MDITIIQPYMKRANLELKAAEIISTFRHQFVKTNLIEQEYGELLGVGFESRQESDYELIPIIDVDFCGKRIDNARRFVERIERYVSEANGE